MIRWTIMRLKGRAIVLSILVLVSAIGDLSAASSDGAPCEFGITECPDHEECAVNNRSRTGACRCVEGYARAAASGRCEPVASSTSGSSTSTATTSAAIRETAATSTTANGEATTKIDQADGGSNGKPEMIGVRVQGPKKLRLPIKDDVNLTAIIDWKRSENASVDSSDHPIRYFWSIKSSSPMASDDHPAVLEGRENETVHLRELHAGNYTILLRVVDLVRNKTLEVDWKLNVLPEVHPRKPPIATIQPPGPVEGVKENMQVILDGSGSKYEGKTPAYTWTQLDGPVIATVGDQSVVDGVLSRSAALILSSLHAGNYTFKLTVTDGQGLQSSALSRVFVTAEVDYPPKAVAGSCDGGTLGDVAVRLPITALYLCGNMSTDDKGIRKWKWTLKDTNKNTADMEGTGSSVLKVWNLHAGDYTFTLAVEDAKGQTSSADLHLVVMPALNHPPVAKAGQNRTIKYPESSAILDGSLSSDDKRITSYVWSQLEGPSDAVLTNTDKVRATVSGLHSGVYAFGLNVTDDEGVHDFDVVYITVDASDNRPPQPVASDVSVVLPCNTIALDASQSTDDAGVVRWTWSQHENSPAGLEILGNSFEQSSLRLADLSPGVFTFNLTVFDLQGASGSKLVSLNVTRGAKENQTVELYLTTKFSDFTIRQQRKLNKQLKALLETNPEWDRVDVNFTKVTYDPNDGSVRILFYATASSYNANVDGGVKLLRASVVASFLDKHQQRSEFMTEFTIRQIDSLYCQNNCSNRGQCQEYSKRCVCDRYWMPNLFALYKRGVAKDCDWSILYFVLVLLLIAFTLLCVFWSIGRAGRLGGGAAAAAGRKRCCGGAGSTVAERTRAVARRVRRYRALKNRGDDEKRAKATAISLKAVKGRNGHTRTMDDDSDSSSSSSEEETVYDRTSLLHKDHSKNHHQANGVDA